MDFENRVALVTGGTGALGSAIVLELLRGGARVIVTYRSGGEWQALEKRVDAEAGSARERLTGVSLDVTRTPDVDIVVRELHERHGHIDFLLTVAGGFAAGKSYETDDRTWEQMLNLNLCSAFIMLRAVVPLMIRRNFGRIVTVSSGAILHSPGAGIAAYAVSKGAVRQLSEILAEEVKEYDIRVRCLMPGTMDTEANRRAMPKADFSKWVKTEEVATLVHSLLLDDALQPLVVPVGA